MLLDASLQPRRPVLRSDGGQITFQNLVGSVRLSSGDIVEVSPKVDVDADWTQAVIHLLEANTRIAVTGSQRSRPSSRSNDLSSALAIEYANRLEAALRRTGPLDAYQRRNRLSRRLDGRLDVTRWIRSSILNPAIFPVTRDELTTANDFTQGMSVVAGWLARAATDGHTALRLRRLQTAVMPGHAVPTHVNPSVARRTLPAQWRQYKPAWDIAAALLRHLSVVGDPGRVSGLEVAVEPWPMLETALTRALQTLADKEEAFSLSRKRDHPLLKVGTETATSVVPDGLLYLNQVPAAAFECKYAVRAASPTNSHVHQALATAAAVGSPLAVLVYPDDGPVERFQVVGFSGKPHQLVVMGLSLYTYRRRAGDDERADMIRQIILAVRGAGWPATGSLPEGTDLSWLAPTVAYVQPVMPVLEDLARASRRSYEEYADDMATGRFSVQVSSYWDDQHGTLWVYRLIDTEGVHDPINGSGAHWSREEAVREAKADAHRYERIFNGPQWEDA